MDSETVRRISEYIGSVSISELPRSAEVLDGDTYLVLDGAELKRISRADACDAVARRAFGPLVDGENGALKLDASRLNDSGLPAGYGDGLSDVFMKDFQYAELPDDDNPSIRLEYSDGPFSGQPDLSTSEWNSGIGLDSVSLEDISNSVPGAIMLDSVARSDYNTTLGRIEDSVKALEGLVDDAAENLFSKAVHEGMMLLTMSELTPEELGYGNADGYLRWNNDDFHDCFLRAGPYNAPSAGLNAAECYEAGSHGHLDPDVRDMCVFNQPEGFLDHGVPSCLKTSRAAELSEDVSADSSNKVTWSVGGSAEMPAGVDSRFSGSVKYRRRSHYRQAPHENRPMFTRTAIWVNKKV